MLLRRYLSWLLAVVPLLVAGCGKQGPNPVAEEVHRLPRVQTVQPARGSMPIQLELLATVEPMEKAELCARVPGMVESMRLDPDKPEVDIGRRVKAGEKLVKLAVPDLEADKKLKEAMLEQAESQLHQAIEAANVSAKELEEAKEQEKRYQADYTFRKDKHDRTVQMVQRSVLQQEIAAETKSQLEAAEAAVQAGRAQVGTKEAKLVAAKVDVEFAESKIKVAKAEVERLAVLVDFATIRAKFDGVVTKRWVDPGAMIKDGAAPVLTVQRLDTVRVLLDIPERDVPLVNAKDQNPHPDGEGDWVTVRIPALRQGDNKGEFKGQITRLASALDPNTRTMRAEVDLVNEGGTLRPGMTGTAMILLDQRYPVLTLPSSALVRQGDDMEVFCVSEPQGNPLQGTVQRRKVRLGIDDGRRVEILDGLKEKDLIIAKGNGVVREGDKVIAVPVGP